MPSGADVIVVPEVKAVPLGHALSARTGLPYAVVRKVRKPYMVDTIDAEVVSITTGAPQQLDQTEEKPIVQTERQKGGRFQRGRGA